MTWKLIESDGALREVVDMAGAASAVMVDTEFMRRNTFYPQAALVQLCFATGDADGPPATAWLVDPLAIDDPAPLAGLLRDEGITKVMHSASEDLEVFQRWPGALPRPLFDTQRAAALLNRGFGMGYRALVHEVTGVELPKGETRSDWLRRPLTGSQCEYAAQDVSYLVPVWKRLAADCVARDRMAWVLEDCAAAVASAQASSGEYHLRVKGARQLDRRQLAALAAVCRWREEQARGRDKPRGWIIDDPTCLAIAREDPRDRRALAERVQVPPPVLRRYGDALLDLLEEQRARAESDLPPPLPRPLDAVQRRELKRLKSRAREIAADLDVAPEALLPSGDYELLLREGAGEKVAAPPHWSGWREERVLAPLRRSLAEAA